MPEKFFYLIEWLVMVTKSFACSNCNSQKTSAVKIKSAWGPIGRIVEYPGLGYEVTCHECGHKEINNQGAPTPQQVITRTWISALLALIPVLVYFAFAL